VLTFNKALRPIGRMRNVRASIPGRRVKVEYDENLVTTDRVTETLAEEDEPAGPLRRGIWHPYSFS
jgi:hypothetical protein